MTTEGPKPPKSTVTGNEGETAKTLEQQKQVDYAQQMIEAKILSIKQLEEEKRIMREINEALGESFEAQKNIFAQNQISINEYLSALKKAKDNGLELAGVTKKIDAQFQKSFKGSEAVSKQVSKIVTDGIKHKKSLEEIEAEVEKFRGQLKRAEAAGDSFSVGIFKATKSIGLAAKASDTMTGSLFENIKAFKSLGEVAQGEALEAMKKSIQQATGFRTIFASLADSIIKASLEFDTASRSLEKSFASYDKFHGLLLANSGAMAKMGHSASDQAKIVSTLAENIGLLSTMHTDLQVHLKDTSGILESMGVSATTGAEIISSMSRVTGKGAEELANFTVELVANAEQFGKTAKQFVDDFSSMSETLLAYGESAEEVFYGIQKLSQELDVAANSLLDTANSFDKFSDAAENAAKLNSLFGMNISAMGMHLMDADQRLEELRRSFDASGHSIQNMNRYQKLALKEAGGFKTMADTVKFFGGRLSDAEEQEHKLQQAGDELNHTMQVMAMSILPLAKQLEGFFANIAQNQTVLTATTKILKVFGDLLVVASENMGWTIYSILALKGAGILLPPILSAMAAGTLKMNMALSAGTLGMVIGLAAAVFLLHAAVTKRASPPFYMLLGIVAVGIFAIGKAADMSIAGLLALGAAVLMVGLGVSAMFYSLSMVIDSFTNFITTISGVHEILPAMAMGVIGLAGGLMLLGGSGIFAMTGMLMTAVGLTAILAAFRLTGVDVNQFIKGGADEIMKIGEGVGNFGSGLEKIKAAASGLKAAIGDSMIAASMEGNKMSLVVGGDAGVATLFKNDTLNIKVDMPTIKMPKPEFKIFIDGKEIDARVEERFNRNFK